MEKTLRNLNTNLRRNSSISKQSPVKQDYYENVSESEIIGLSLNPNSIAWLLGIVAFILIFASIATDSAYYLTGFSSVLLSKFVKIFSLDLELNVPNFFSMLLLLFAALLLAFITVIKRKQTASYIWHWAILSFGFFFMAFDEIASIHEKLIEPMQAILGKEQLGILYFAWVVPGIALVLFLAFIFLRFWWNLPAKTRFAFLIAATLYIGGAIVLELIGGSHFEIYGKDNLTYILLTTVEESFEIVGVIIFIRALLGYIADTYREVEVRFNMRRRND